MKKQFAAECLRELINDYYRSRPHLMTVRPPLCVFFLACSGAGKSTVRSYLVKNLGATYVCNDEVRELLASHPEASRLGIGLKDVVAGTIEKIFAEANNRFIVYDNNIIQYYRYEDSYIAIAKKSHRPIFVIGLDVAEDELRRRIKRRGVNVDSILAELPGQIADYGKAVKDITADTSLGDVTDEKQLQELAQKVQRSML